MLIKMLFLFTKYSNVYRGSFSPEFWDLCLELKFWRSFLTRRNIERMKKGMKTIPEAIMRMLVILLQSFSHSQYIFFNIFIKWIRSFVSFSCCQTDNFGAINVSYQKEKLKRAEQFIRRCLFISGRVLVFLCKFCFAFRLVLE